jgi:hypothetical protein
MNEILAMDKRRLEAYFMEFAQYMEDSPNRPYIIRVGSRTLSIDDTMNLRKQFEAHVRKLKRRAAYLKSKN